MNLVDMIAATQRDPSNVRAVVATVVGVGPGGATVDVRINDSDVAGVPVFGLWQTPVVGAVVLVLKIGSAWTVLGPTTSTGAPPAQYLADPSFEQSALGTGLPSGWRQNFYNVEGTPADRISVVDAAHTGARATRLLLYPNLVTFVSLRDEQAIPCLPGQVWRLGAWIRSDNAVAGVGGTTNGAKFRLYLDTAAAPSSLTVNDSVELVNTFPSREWTYVSANVAIPANALWCRPTFSVWAWGTTGCSGAVLVDDVNLTRVS